MNTAGGNSAAWNSCDSERFGQIWTVSVLLSFIMLFLDVFGCFWKQHETTTFVISCTFLCVVFVRSSLGSLPAMLGDQSRVRQISVKRRVMTGSPTAYNLNDLNVRGCANSMAWSSTDATTCSRDHDLVIQALKIIPSCKRYCCNLGHGVSASVCSTPLSM